MLWSVTSPALQYFSTLSHKRHCFRKEVIEHKIGVFVFSTSFFWKISHAKKNWARYDHKCVLIVIKSIRYSCHILMKLEFSRKIFEKYASIKFHENPPSQSGVVPWGRRDRHDEADSRFSHLCERTEKRRLSVVEVGDKLRKWQIFAWSNCEGIRILKSVFHFKPHRTVTQPRNNFR